MRGTKAKLNRRRAQASKRSVPAIDLAFVFGKGGAGKSLIAGMVAKDARTPRGTWKEFWQKKIQNISEKNRLPRGFKEPNRFRIARFGEMETTSWLDR
jgi:ABC-type ATPase involved in cell division